MSSFDSLYVMAVFSLRVCNTHKYPFGWVPWSHKKWGANFRSWLPYWQQSLNWQPVCVCPSHLAADMITVDLLSAFRKQISRGFWVVREEPTQTQIFQLYIRNRRPRSFKKIDWISRGNKYMGSTESIVSRSGCLQVCSRPNHFQHHKSPTAYSVAAVYPHFQKPYRASPHPPPTPPALVQMQAGSLPVLLKISCPSHVYQLPSLFNYWLISFLWPWRPSSLSWSHRLPCSFLPALPTPDISLSLWPQMRWGQADLPLT